MKKVKSFFSAIGRWFKNHLPTKRRLIQLYTALLYNANLKGYIDGQLFNGATKKLCLPGFNCYSCPGAIGACPLGSLQNALTNANHKWTAYVFGIIALFGISLGRMICGFFCPVGLCQELLYKVPTPKIKKSWLTRIFSYFKHVILVMMVVILPIMYIGGTPVPSFCKYICPTGIFEGAFGLVPNNPEYYDALQVIFTWKFALLIVFIVLSMVLFRFFCRFICPLGALYGFFCKVALLGVKVDKKKCTDCGLCIAVCKMDVKSVGDHECIQCGECMSICPTKAITWKGASLFVRTNDLDAPTPEGKPLTAFLKEKAEQTEMEAVAEPAVETAVEAKEEPAVENTTMNFVSEPTTMQSAIEARAKEKRRNKLIEIVAWCLAGVLLVGAWLYANVFVKATPKQNNEYLTVSVVLEDLKTDGKTYDLGNLEKPMIVNFWYVGCSNCEAEMPDLNEFHETYNGAVETVAIHGAESLCYQPKEVAAAFVKEIKVDVHGKAWNDYSIGFAMDVELENGSLYEILGGNGAWPMTVILGTDGEILYRTMGVFNGDAMREVLDAELAEIAENA